MNYQEVIVSMQPGPLPENKQRIESANATKAHAWGEKAEKYQRNAFRSNSSPGGRSIGISGIVLLGLPR